jgi:hypothetical protein
MKNIRKRREGQNQNRGTPKRIGRLYESGGGVVLISIGIR